MLRSQTPKDWFVRSGVGDPSNLGALLSDHLHCERKAAENALSLVRRYPHDRDFVDTLSRLAHEETSHVIQVATLMQEHGLAPQSDAANSYTRALLSQARSSEPDRRIDLLICAALIEARSHERLRLLADGFSKTGRPVLAEFYTVLANAEERHAEVFLELARPFAAPEPFEARVSELADIEARVVEALPAVPRVH